MRADRFASTCLTLALLLVVSACATAPAVVKRDSIPRGSEIAVIAFRDCLIAQQEDCGGSGSIAGSVVARGLSAGGHFKALPISRPVAAVETLSDDAAVEFGKLKGFPYVINGEVDEFYVVAPMTFRSERAGVSMRLLRVSDGAVIAFYSKRKEASNITTPDRMILKMTEEFRDALVLR